MKFTLFSTCLFLLVNLSNSIYAKNNNRSLLLQQRLNSSAAVVEDDERPKVPEKKPTCDVVDDEGYCVGQKTGLPSGVIGDAEGGEDKNKEINLPNNIGGFLPQKEKVLAKDVLIQQQNNPKTLENTTNSTIQNSKPIVMNIINNPMNRFMQQLYQPNTPITKNYPANVMQIPAPQILNNSSPAVAKPIRIIPR